jgi:hypothetical protein
MRFPTKKPVRERNDLPVQKKQRSAVRSLPAVPVFQFMPAKEEEDVQLKKENNPGMPDDLKEANVIGGKAIQMAGQ